MIQCSSEDTATPLGAFAQQGGQIDSLNRKPLTS